MYRCNNCNIGAPIEELRVAVERNNNIWFLCYRNKMERPQLFLDMLLCGRCKILYWQWARRLDHAEDRRRGRKGRLDATLLPLSNWFSKQLLKQYAEAQSRLSLERWKVPVSADHRQIIATA